MCVSIMNLERSRISTSGVYTAISQQHSYGVSKTMVPSPFVLCRMLLPPSSCINSEADVFETLLGTCDHEHRLGSFQRPAAVKKNVVTPDFFKRHK